MDCRYPDCLHPARCGDYCYRHASPAIKSVKRVWKGILANPGASVRELAADLHLSTSTVQRAIWSLERCNAICKEPKASRTTTIKVARCQGKLYRAVWLDL